MFNLSLSLLYLEISKSFLNKWTGVAETVNDIKEVKVNKNRIEAES